MSVVLASVLLCLNLFLQTAAKPTPRENPGTAVVEAIRLLESKDYRMFLSQFVPPDQLKARAGTPEAFNAFVQEFPIKADSRDRRI